MPTEDQLKSILNAHGVSDKSMEFLEGPCIFPKASKSDRNRTGRETQRYPHISPPAGETPAHLTNIRFVKTSGAHDIIQRFHQHINESGVLNAKKLHDRFRAIERNSGAICSVSVIGAGPAARDDWSVEQLRQLNYTANLQINEQSRLAIMSKAVMNKYNLGVRT